MGQHFNLFQLVVSNEMGSLEEVVTVSLAEMEEGEIVDHGDGDPDGINLFSVPFKALKLCFFQEPELFWNPYFLTKI